MRSNAQLLVIGPSALGSAVADALPRCKSVSTDNLLGGLWTIGHREFDGVIVSYGLGQRVLTAIRNMRQVAPQARIVVAVSPSDEPKVREALDVGADEYVIEPVRREELESALGIVPAPRHETRAADLPSVEEVVQLSDVLRRLQEGPQSTLDRLAALLQSAFAAEGVAIRVDELSATVGRASQPVLQEPIRRGEQVVGSIALGRRTEGTFAAADATRLGDYARLIETVMEQVHERQHWQELAWRDDLTGLRNRRYFDATLADLLGKAAAERLRVTVLLFDIDDFKSYNDNYGHQTGDALLREVATLLTHCSREHDVVARYGGDEFSIILWDAEKPRVPGSQHPSEPRELADRFRHAIHQHSFQCLGPDAPGPVTISGGLACFPWDGKSCEDITRSADEALLAAKRTGKNRILLANGSSSQQQADEASAES